MLQSLHELNTYEKPKRYILSSAIFTVSLFINSFPPFSTTSLIQSPPVHYNYLSPWKPLIGLDFLAIAWRKRRELYKPIVKPNVKNKSKQKLLRIAKLKTAFSINQKRSYKEALSWAELSVPWLASSNSASSFRRLTYLVL